MKFAKASRLDVDGLIFKKSKILSFLGWSGAIPAAGRGTLRIAEIEVQGIFKVKWIGYFVSYTGPD